MGGHLFVVRGDIRHLACSAWLLPTDGDLEIEPGWLRDFARLEQAREAGAASKAITDEDDWRTGSRVARLLGREGAAGSVWLANVGGHGGTAIETILAPVAEFVRRAAVGEPRPDADVRDRPLLAIPFVGTGEGGAARKKGDVALGLVDVLDAVLADVDADVVVVLANDASFAAMQHARRSRWSEGWRERWAAALGEEALATGEALADDARRQRLVFFVGAGLGAAAGLPHWSALLTALATDAGIDLESLERLGSLDRATVIDSALRKEQRTLGRAVQQHIPVGGPYSVAHALIASLPVGEVVTTNYDRLLEAAATDAGRPFTLLDRPVADADRWLLKLHGDIEDPESIVLSRDDYLGYAQGRAALRGIVQAMLITRHMVFAGFGMSDENFHAILHDVRTAVGSTSEPARAFGTALLVKDHPLFDQLWRGDIQSAALGPQHAATGVGARRMEVLLDFVLAESAGGLAHFLHPDFDGLLSPDEQELRARLMELWEARGASPAWSAFVDFAARLGAGRSA